VIWEPSAKVDFSPSKDLQGLKPAQTSGPVGTTEVVPCYKAACAGAPGTSLRQWQFRWQGNAFRNRPKARSAQLRDGS
jgi:hypothetical protein